MFPIVNCIVQFLNKWNKKKLFDMQLSKFLSAMQDEGVVKVKEVSKGVESIAEIDFKHVK